jgi:hypothetical protein
VRQNQARPDDGAHDALGEVKCMQIFMGEDEQPRQLPSDCREILQECMDLFGTGERPVAGCCEEHNETSCSIKRSEECTF